MALEFIPVKSQADAELRTPRIMTHETDHLTLRGRCVMTLIEKWGMVFAADGGEDSSGRAKVKAEEVQQTVDRAISMVHYAFIRLKEQGDLLQAPAWNELREMVDAKDKVEA